MSLTHADVAKVALLARLRLEPDELETFTGQLNSIVDYVAQLQELDTTGVEPLAHGIEVRNVFRDDVRGPRSTASKPWPTLRNATERRFWCRRFWNEHALARIIATRRRGTLIDERWYNQCGWSGGPTEIQ